MVVRLGDSTPLRRARVLLSADAEGEKSWMAETDEAGLFELKDVDTGRYRLRVSRDGFVPLEYGQRTPSVPGAVLSLSAGQEVKDLLFRMIPSAVISGRVLNEDGEPLPWVQMAAVHYGYSHGKRKIFSNYEARAETNDLGEFRLFGLPPGRYLVRTLYIPDIHEPGRLYLKLIKNEKDSSLAYLPAYYPNTTDAAKAAAIQVKAGEAVSAIDFILSRSRVQKIKGKAFRAAAAKGRRGDMWVYAVSRISGVAESKMNSHSAQMASDGTFEIADLASGPYWVRAYESADEKSYQAQQAVDVGDADVEGVSLVLAPGIELRGHFAVEGRGGPLSGEFTVGLISDEDPYEQNGGEVKNDGSFVMGNVLEGAYKVWVGRESFDAYLKAARYGTLDALENGVTIQRGSDATLEIMLSLNGARVEGLVTNADSLPATGVWVVLVPEAARRNQERLFKTATTDQNGRFSLRGIAPGEYKLFSWEEVEPGAWLDPDFLKPYESKGETVRVEEGGHASVDLKLIPADKPQEGR